MKNRLAIIGFTGLALLLLVLGCSKKQTTAPTGGGTALQFNFPKSAATLLVDQVTMEVHGAEDFSRYDTAQVINEEFQFEEFQIPAGPALFSFKALTGLMETYTALVEVDIVGGEINYVMVDFELPERLGTVSGVVSDAVTGMPVAGALVSVADKSAVTDMEGAYTLTDVQPGYYTMHVSLEGYIQVDREVQIVGGEQTINFVMSTIVEGWRFVLTWDVQPSDLDLHLWTGIYHIFYFNQGMPGEPPYAYLDIDDVNGYGPETITVEQVESVCQIYVNNYSGYPLLRESNARIDIYAGSQRLWSYEVPGSGNEGWWYVCDLLPDGTIDTKNYLTDSPPGVATNAAEPKSK